MRRFIVYVIKPCTFENNANTRSSRTKTDVTALFCSYSSGLKNPQGRSVVCDANAKCEFENSLFLFLCMLFEW